MLLNPGGATCLCRRGHVIVPGMSPCPGMAFLGAASIVGTGFAGTVAPCGDAGSKRLLFPASCSGVELGESGAASPNPLLNVPEAVTVSERIKLTLVRFAFQPRTQM